jgi:hypothetical protein
MNEEGMSEGMEGKSDVLCDGGKGQRKREEKDRQKGKKEGNCVIVRRKGRGREG